MRSLPAEQTRCCGPVALASESFSKLEQTGIVAQKICSCGKLLDLIFCPPLHHYARKILFSSTRSITVAQLVQPQNEFVPSPTPSVPPPLTSRCDHHHSRAITPHPYHPQPFARSRTPHLYFSFVLTTSFYLTRSRYFSCPSAPSNPTGVTVPRRTDSVRA